MIFLYFISVVGSKSNKSYSKNSQNTNIIFLNLSNKAATYYTYTRSYNLPTQSNNNDKENTLSLFSNHY